MHKDPLHVGSGEYIAASMNCLSLYCAVFSTGFGFTCSLHCSSVLGLPVRILYVELVKPQNGTTMETIGSVDDLGLRTRGSGWRVRSW